MVLYLRLQIQKLYLLHNYLSFQKAGNQIKLVVLREEEGGGDITTDGEGDRTSMSSQEISSNWVGFIKDFLGLFLMSSI